MSVQRRKEISIFVLISVLKYSITCQAPVKVFLEHFINLIIKRGFPKNTCLQNLNSLPHRHIPFYYNRL